MMKMPFIHNDYKFSAYLKAWPFLIIVLLFLIYWFSLPRNLFKDPVSTIIEDNEGNLLGAKIADDGQWRFPEKEKVPEKFEKAILTFEDKFFYFHVGFNPVSLYRAAFQDIRVRHIVSGGSTLTMQVIRLSRKGKPRNIYQKLVEIILAIRLELTNSKKHILSLYASNAPFGGNVVGLKLLPGDISDEAAVCFPGLKQPPLLYYLTRHLLFIREKTGSYF